MSATVNAASARTTWFTSETIPAGWALDDFPDEPLKDSDFSLRELNEAFRMGNDDPDYGIGQVCNGVKLQIRTPVPMSISWMGSW